MMMRRGVMAAKTGTASILYAYVKFDQTQSDETKLISVSDTPDGTRLTCPTTSWAPHPNAAIQAIRDASHLYMGKQMAAGKQLLCQLSDSNGEQYTDGTAAKFDGTEGDHWMRIGVEVYIKRVIGTDNGDTVVYGIAVGGQPDATWKQIISLNGLPFDCDIVDLGGNNGYMFK